jgi:hypothetical protein
VVIGAPFAFLPYVKLYRASESGYGLGFLCLVELRLLSGCEETAGGFQKAVASKVLDLAKALLVSSCTQIISSGSEYTGPSVLQLEAKGSTYITVAMLR